MVNPELLNKLRAFYKYNMEHKGKKTLTAGRADVREDTRPEMRVPEIECT